jgi:hypothetical protein
MLSMTIATSWSSVVRKVISGSTGRPSSLCSVSADAFGWLAPCFSAAAEA